MAKEIHDDVRDSGLTQISAPANWGGGVMSMVMCMGRPADATDAATLYPAGKRVSDVIAMVDGDYTLQSRSGGGREVSVGAKSSTAAASVFAALVGGTATGGSATALVDTGIGWTVDEHVGWVCVITAGTGSGQREIIASNTIDVLVPENDWVTAPDATSVYDIRPDVCVVHYDGGGTPRVLVIVNESQDNDVANASTLNIPAHTVGLGPVV